MIYQFIKLSNIYTQNALCSYFVPYIKVSTNSLQYPTSKVTELDHGRCCGCRRSSPETMAEAAEPKPIRIFCARTGLCPLSCCRSTLTRMIGTHHHPLLRCLGPSGSATAHRAPSPALRSQEKRRAQERQKASEPQVRYGLHRVSVQRGRRRGSDEVTELTVQTIGCRLPSVCVW
jgi:hypothetical protein